MIHIDRRALTAGAAAAIALGAPFCRTRAQGALKRFRMLLNTSFSGPQAWILLAQDNGYLQREGIELELITGGGAYTAAPRMTTGGFDLGYGDINSLIEVVAREPGRRPLPYSSPSMPHRRRWRLMPADRSDPKDLEGKTVIGHYSDVALRTFGAFCRRRGSTPRASTSGGGGSMAGHGRDMLGWKSVHGVFGYVSTLAAAIAAADRDLRRRVRYLRYAELVPDLYGSALMVSRRLVGEKPARWLVSCVHSMPGSPRCCAISMPESMRS